MPRTGLPTLKRPGRAADKNVVNGVRQNLRLRVLLPTAVIALLGVGVGAFAFTGTPDSTDPIAPLAGKRDASPKSAPAVSRGRWARQANVICRQVTADVKALGQAQSRDEMVALFPRAIDLGTAGLTELEALPKPRGDRVRVQQMLRAIGRFVALNRQALAALEAGDMATFAQHSGRAFAHNERAARLADALGVPACGEGTAEDTELARELDAHGVVVAVLYSPDATIDALAIREARAGAGLAEAGFVAIDAFDPKEIAPVAAQFTIRGAPAILVVSRREGAVTQFDGYVDRETVAQAVANASA